MPIKCENGLPYTCSVHFVTILNTLWTTVPPNLNS